MDTASPISTPSPKHINVNPDLEAQQQPLVSESDKTVPIIKGLG
jgi:hypothetical protein